MIDEPKKRGGARPGAGRKSVARHLIERREMLDEVAGILAPVKLCDLVGLVIAGDFFAARRVGVAFRAARRRIIDRRHGRRAPLTVARPALSQAGLFDGLGAAGSLAAPDRAAGAPIVVEGAARRPGAAARAARRPRAAMGKPG